MARPDCPICQGSGWNVVERTTDGAQALASADSARPGASVGEPKMVWAVPCDCTVGDRAERALARARVPEHYRHCDFENFETDNDIENVTREQLAAWNRSLEQTKLVVRRFAEEYSPLDRGSGQGLLLMGQWGVGKTHLAIAALKEIVKRGCAGLFYDYGELLKEIRSSYSSENPITESNVLQPVLSAEVLLLDDLGSSKPSHWALETVGHILGTRYNAKRPTIITTNFLDPEFRRDSSRAGTIQSGNPRFKEGPPSDPSRSRKVVQLPSGEFIAEYGEDSLEERVGKRIRSRLHEMCRTVEVFAPDYRKEIRNLTRRA
jgi:DNA replication protein DnaC